MITAPAAILIFVFGFDGTTHFSSHNAMDTMILTLHKNTIKICDDAMYYDTNGGPTDRR